MTSTPEQNHPTFELPSNLPSLGKNDVHLWQTSLDYSEDELNQFDLLLAPDEKIRANRFHFLKDRIRYTAARGILRKILGAYLHLAPQKIIFTYNEHGKPTCLNHETLQFNLSHSKKNAVYAFAQNLRLGIDIEFVDQDTKVDSLAHRFFSSVEANQLQQMEGQKKIRAFFNGWTRKEAFAKALGLGLSYSLKKTVVSLDPQDPAKFMIIDDPQQDINNWSLYSLDQIPHYAAALVVEGKNHKLIWLHHDSEKS